MKQIVVEIGCRGCIKNRRLELQRQEVLEKLSKYENLEFDSVVRKFDDSDGVISYGGYPLESESVLASAASWAAIPQKFLPKALS